MTSRSGQAANRPRQTPAVWDRARVLAPRPTRRRARAGLLFWVIGATRVGPEAKRAASVSTAENLFHAAARLCPCMQRRRRRRRLQPGSRPVGSGGGDQGVSPPLDKTSVRPVANLAERIMVDPEQCGGRPCMRGMRIRVTDVLDLLASGLTPQEVLRGLPDVDPGVMRQR